MSGERVFTSVFPERNAQPDSATAAAPASHKVSVIYPSRAEAEAIRQALIDCGLAAGDIAVLHDVPPPAPLREPVGERGSDEVLKDVIIDSVIGSAVGTGIGAIGSVIMIAANVTMFVASPVVAPLAMLGWFAGVGGILGAAAGTSSRREGKFSELVGDAIQAGNTVLVAHTRNEAERQLVKAVINDSFKGRDEIVRS
ncbi:MAG: hypothetical protein ACM3X0_02210 [Bacteroidota bacterium]